MELFFDLVYVFAITQLSHLLLEHLDVRGALQTLLLLFAVWWTWIYNAWFTNWFDPDNRTVRLALVAIMLASLLMAASIPEAFGDRGLFFAAAYTAIHAGRPLFIVLVSADDPLLRRNFQRILAWCLVSGVFWLAGGVADGSTRELLWLVAVAVDFVAPAFGFFTPGLGRSATSEWAIDGEHLAERCRLFLIIALGESLLITGGTFAGLDFTRAAVMALTVAFLGSVAFWWVYFDRASEVAGEIIAQSEDPGRLGRSAYTYFHLPMVAGIIVAAVGDELSIAHPTGDTDLATALVILGGPALFLAGHALFKFAVFEVFPVSRLIAVGALAALLPVSAVVSPLMLAASATLVVAGVGAWDTRVHRSLPHSDVAV
jgi:low temperature requirement protein LtrA